MKYIRFILLLFCFIGWLPLQGMNEASISRLIKRSDDLYCGFCMLLRAPFSRYKKGKEIMRKMKCEARDLLSEMKQEDLQGKSLRDAKEKLLYIDKFGEN